MTPSRHAYGITRIDGNVVWIGRLQPARRTDEELARAIREHTAQILRERARERDDQYAGLREVFALCAGCLIAGLVAYGATQILVALAAVMLGEG